MARTNVCLDEEYYHGENHWILQKIFRTSSKSCSFLSSSLVRFSHCELDGPCIIQSSNDSSRKMALRDNGSDVSDLMSKGGMKTENIDSA